ncbi:uncharacterized protein LOC141648040 isoform X6 [Silene latifolia]|uniref:uncharacterized protein LOC141648040 isoform X6 n=1 Tax=Silene latifolia TaxID=37657 RepID=UPI003D77B96D
MAWFCFSIYAGVVLDCSGQGDYVYDEASGYYYTNSSGYYYDPSTGLFWLHPQDSEVGASYTPTLISIISLHSILAMNELICTHLPYTDLFRGRICSSSIGVARKHNLILGTEMFRGLGL